MESALSHVIPMTGLLLLRLGCQEYGACAQVIRVEDAIERLLLREVLEINDTAAALSATDAASGGMSPANADGASNPGSPEVDWMYTPPGHRVGGLSGST